MCGSGAVVCSLSLLIREAQACPLSGRNSTQRPVQILEAGSYPVTVTTPNENDDDMEGGTITWRGTVFQDVTLGEGCKYNFVATNRDGDTAELCTATKGYADLTIGRARFYCQMK